MSCEQRARSIAPERNLHGKRRNTPAIGFDAHSVAQALLCPFDDLMSYMGTGNPSDDDITAAARHFDVSERVIRTTLVNKRVIERELVDDN